MWQKVDITDGIAVLCVDSKIVRFIIDILVFLGYQFPNIKSHVVLVKIKS